MFRPCASHYCISWQRHSHCRRWCRRYTDHTAREGRGEAEPCHKQRDSGTRSRRAHVTLWTGRTAYTRQRGRNCSIQWTVHTHVPCNMRHNRFKTKAKVTWQKAKKTRFVLAVWQHKIDGLAAISNCMIQLGRQIKDCSGTYLLTSINRSKSPLRRRKWATGTARAPNSLTQVPTTLHCRIIHFPWLFPDFPRQNESFSLTNLFTRNPMSVFNCMQSD